MLKKERQAYILQQLQLHRKVVTSSLCRAISVCEDTVRRDLQELSEEGKLVKVHGGALVHSFHHEPSDEMYIDELNAAKIIGQKAATLVHDNLFILTTGGSTILEMARSLRQDIHATFMSGSIPLVTEYLAHPGVEVILIGDKVSRKTRETGGVEAVDRIRRLKADLCFIDIRAIDIRGGIMENDWEVAQVKRAMIDSSQKVIGLLTSNKLNSFMPLPVCMLKQMDCLVTELDPDDELLARYADSGIEII
jgi:DeoR/GlpR family transcriptional regulator of sugar metabolism